MTTIIKRQVYFIAVLTILSFLVLFPTIYKAIYHAEYEGAWISKSIRLGLDLKGGSYLILGVQTKEAVKSRLVATAGAVRAQLREAKVPVTRAQQVNDRDIEFVLLGDRNLAKLEEAVRDVAPNLSKLKEERGDTKVTVTYQMGEKDALDVEKNSVTQAIETIRNRVDQYGVAEPTIQRSGETHIMVELPEITNIDQVKQTIGSVAKLEFRLVANVNTPPDKTVPLKSREGGQVRVEDEVLMTGAEVENATVEYDPQNNKTGVNMRLNSFGKTTFARITSENVQRQLAIVLDGLVQSSPVINEPILQGSASITGRFSRDDANRLMIVLRSGALPAPLTFEEQRTVGATLGSDAVNRGIQAIIVGSLMVFVFVVVYYRKCGWLAVLCLLLCLLYLVASLSLLGATLTLPGLGGLALTVGMAVDSNILIYERIREELRLGASGKVAIDAGFDKVHWTILDSNLTTLITGVILYLWGTGPIRGFAVTLSLGIISTLFMALFVCRVGFYFFNMRTVDGEISI